MEIRKKLKILTWIFIVFVVLTISTFFFLLGYLQKINSKIEPIPINHKHNSPGMFADYIIQNIKLSEDQHTKILDFQTKFRNNALLLLDSIRYYNEKADELLEKADFDNPNFNLYASKIAHFQFELKKNFWNYYRNIYLTLDASQQKDLFTHYKEFRKCCQVKHKRDNKHHQNCQTNN